MVEKNSFNLINFFNNTKVKLGFYNWKLRLISNTNGGYCWMSDKTIECGLLNKEPKNLILHELAHIGTCRFCNNPHNLIFWKTYEDYIRRFLPESKPQSRYLHDFKNRYGIGYLDSREVNEKNLKIIREGSNHDYKNYLL